MSPAGRGLAEILLQAGLVTPGRVLGQDGQHRLDQVEREVLVLNVHYDEATCTFCDRLYMEHQTNREFLRGLEP